MNNIPERFQVTGIPVDGGERVTGYYIRYEHMGYVQHIIVTNFAQVYVNSCRVDPATIEPVRVRPIDTDDYEICSNCKSPNISFMRTNDYGHPPEPFQCDFCPDCGMALDWSAPPKTGLRGE